MADMLCCIQLHSVYFFLAVQMTIQLVTIIAMTKNRKNGRKNHVARMDDAH